MDRNIYFERKIKRKLIWNVFSGFSVTAWIIVINVIAYFLMLFLISFSGENLNFLLNFFALKPDNIIHGRNLWVLITHMFFHIWFFHLFVNMLSLWFLGRFVERIVGRKRFLWFYLISGVFAGLLSSFLAGFFGYGFFGERIFGQHDVAMLGASGAIFGVVGLLAVLVPRAKAYLIAGPMIALIIGAIAEVVIKSQGMLSIVSIVTNIYIVVSIFCMFSFNQNFRKIALPLEMSFWLLPIIAIVPLVIIGLFLPLPIGNVAHFGGLLAGLVYGYYLRAKYKRKIKMLQGIFR